MFIKFDPRNSKYVYRTLLIKDYLFVYIITSLSIKLIMGFLAKFLGFLKGFLFFIDCLILPFIVMGLWFHFEDS